jgi:hypothetical protein
MAPTSRAGIGFDEETVQLLTKLQQVTGVSRREHLRRAVKRYYDQAADHLTEAALAELNQMPASVKELARANEGRVIARDRGPILRKKFKG